MRTIIRRKASASQACLNSLSLYYGHALGTSLGVGIEVFHNRLYFLLPCLFSNWPWYDRRTDISIFYFIFVLCFLVQLGKNKYLRKLMDFVCCSCFLEKMIPLLKIYCESCDVYIHVNNVNPVMALGLGT